MVVLRADPWNPDYGMGLEGASLEDPSPVVDAFVETSDWSSGVRPPELPPSPLFFVDGVRRIDLRLWAEDDGRRVPGLFGTFAVGQVGCDGAATFGPERVERMLVLGGGVQPGPVEIVTGKASFSYRVRSVAGSDVLAPVVGLQQAMRDEESSLAATLAATPGSVVIVDGPLAFLGRTEAPMVGMVKRLVRSYLGPEQDSLLPRLATRERTPLFSIGTEREPAERLGWYVRLKSSAPPWHDRAGIVRCEVRSGVGVPEAGSLADRIAAMLPGFGGRSSDPRAPQNLAPVGALERWLRHRMGHPSFVRRALQEWLVMNP